MEPGTRLGPYEVVGKLGAGGMGEVWRAHDARLDRDVAIKVLPAGVGDDGDRLVRFEREAKAVAALNHPNIAQVYGLETAPGEPGGPSAGAALIVMELVEGADLSECIAGRPMEIEEALPLARQIAEALEAAHAAGVVHRDLKPANIRVRSDGVLKVLDFGLAKIVESDAADTAPDNSPTLTMRATQAGLILGTAAYMSPEQARGRAVDHRTDIWAFGCVLFEMLSGRRAFEGEDVSMTLASVLKRDLDWNVLPDNTPGPLRRLLARCLTTDVRRRYQAIGDVRIAVEDWIDQGFANPDTGSPGATGSATTRSRLVPLAAAAVVVLAVGALLGRGFAPSSEPPPPTRFAIAAESHGQLAWSPDGHTLALTDPDEGMLVRPRGSEEFRPLAGAEDANQNLVFSPNGEHIAYFAGDRIRRVPATGGTSALVTTTALGFRFCGALTWGRHGDIVFQCSDSRGLWVVPAAGGEPRRLTETDRVGGAHGAPSFLPDGRTVLFAIGSGADANYELAAVSLDSAEPRRLGVAGVQPFYMEPGYVLFARGGAIWSAPFDAASLEFLAEPIPVIEGLVDMGFSFGTARFAASSTGSVAYWSGSRYRRPPRYPAIVDRNGTTLIDFPDQISASKVRFSPDDRRIAFMQRDELTPGAENTVHVADLQRGTVSRVAEGNLADWATSDEVGYVIGDGTDYSLYRVPWDLAQEAEAVAVLGPRHTYEVTWLPEARGFVFASRAPDEPRGPRDLLVGSADGTVQPWLTTPRDERDPQLSPDGSWLAYIATEPGGAAPQVYIRPFPGPGGQLQVSVEAGVAPQWAGDGRRIFFWSDGGIYEVAVEPGEVPTMGTPVRLFDDPGGAETLGAFDYFDVSSDGELFAFTLPVEDLEPNVLHVAYDWLPEIQAMFATDR